VTNMAQFTNSYNPQNYITSGFYNPMNDKNNPFSVYSQQYQQDQNTIHTGALGSLQHDYNQTIIPTVNSLNRRGLFGSSIANEDIGKVNYSMGQAQANLAAQEAERKRQDLFKQQQSMLEYGKFQQTMKAQQAQQKAQQQMQQEQMKQQRIMMNRAAGLPDWK
jgi:hypothetical protein